MLNYNPTFTIIVRRGNEIVNRINDNQPRPRKRQSISQDTMNRMQEEAIVSVQEETQPKSKWLDTVFETKKETQPIIKEEVKQQPKYEYSREVFHDISKFLQGIQYRYGADLALNLAAKLNVTYYTDRSEKKVNNTEIKKEEVKPIIPQPVSIPIESQQLTVQKINGVETVIAPPHPPKKLPCEEEEKWNEIKEKQKLSIDIQNDDVVDEVNKPTSELFPVKPKTVEEISAEEAIAAGNQLMGIPGRSLVDEQLFKEYMPRMRRAVEKFFDDIEIEADTERQSQQLARTIKEFIASSVRDVINDDGSGLEIKVNLTVDHLNRSCFKINAINYGTPLFETLLYPKEKEQEEEIKPEESDQLPDYLSTDEVIQLFTDLTQEYLNNHNIKTNEDKIQSQKELIVILYTALLKLD